MKTLIIGKWKIEWHFAIKLNKEIIPAEDVVFDNAAQLILEEKKLKAIVELKRVYDIPLKECKELLDRVAIKEYDNKGNFAYAFLIKKDRMVIRKFLKNKIHYNYEKR
jgi:hypothetical protein